MKILDLKVLQQEGLDKADAALKAAEAAGRPMTAVEQADYNSGMNQYRECITAEKANAANNTISRFFRSGKPIGAWFDIGRGGGAPEHGLGFMQPVAAAPNAEETETHQYAEALLGYLKSGGKSHGEHLAVGSDGLGGFHIPGSARFTRQRHANGAFPKMSANTFEGTPDGGSGASGGYAVTVPTSDLIVQLALPDLGIFDASYVIPTSTAIKIPQQTAFGTSAIKSESTGTIATFGGSDPTLGQTELDAYMVGALRLVSWELMQDVPTFQQWIVEDLLKGQRIFEGNLLANGTGSSQPTGVFGNTGTGTGSAYELLGTSADSTTLLNSLFDVTSTLKGAYQANASWIMSRATGLVIRKAQMQTNLFAPIATTDPDGTERILGKPVFYDMNAPALPSATSAGVIPILYGDFKQGFIVGVRGGAGINVKILDQPWAAQGQLGILAYRRLDAKVRMSEAIQQVKISHS
jgi:HK97 family phage major capsid protein